jgi:hypothetical protein
MSSIKPDGLPGRQAQHRVLNRPLETMAQASPLAQLFQPLIVDDAIPEDTYLHAGTRDGVSYGPVTRRRRPSATTLQKIATTNRENENEIVSSLGQGPGEQSGLLWEPETAEETQEEESTLGSLEWARRLDSIEKRQKRMEELLSDILAAVGK